MISERTPLAEDEPADLPSPAVAADMYGRTVALNEALILGSLRQHELTEAAEDLNTQLRAEIGARKRTEQALRKSEERFRSLFASAPMAVFVCDRNAIIQQYNKLAEELWGRKPVCGLERHCGSLELWLPNGTRLPHEQSPMVDVLHTGIPALNVELCIERPDGFRLPVLANFAALKDANGEITGAITSFVDITERKASEEEIRNLNADLEQRVKKRTAELVKEIAERKQAEIDLVEAFRVADEANNAKSAFLARMSHEIRTPMNGILGVTYLLKQTTMSLKQSDYAYKIEFSAQNLMGIINDILDFSKIEAGEMELDSVEFSLEGLLSRLVESLSVQAHRKSLEGKIAIAAKTPARLIGDPMRLEQVLANLMGNAIKFTERGEVDVSVDVVERNETHDLLEFKVRDTGIGMSAPQIAKLFEPFSQSDTSRSRRFGGTGLGLVIAKRFVRLMDGEISVQSEPGIGSTFSFTARFKVNPKSAGVEKDNPAATSLTHATDAGDRASGARILVVEDNEINQEIMAEILQVAGYHVTIAADGQTALTILDDTAPGSEFAAVLMDIQMPGLDGYATTRLIRADRRFARLPIIAITADAVAGVKEKCLAAGMNDYLTKPASLDEIYATLKKWIT